MEPFFVAFALVFVAELGDKTQLVALGLATRFRLITVLTGITLAYAITNGVSVAVGGMLGAALPTRVISLAGGILFLGFALWAYRSVGDVQEPDEVALGGRQVLASIIGAMVLAELGDKSMIVAATLAAQGSPLLTWVGATLGVTTASLIAVLVGRFLGDRLPRHAIRIGSTLLFALFGVLLIVEGLR